MCEKKAGWGGREGGREKTIREERRDIEMRTINNPLQQSGALSPALCLSNQGEREREKG